ncbi:hypothetical protein ABZ471_38795 [Streptomyces sp. NPDC005728]|uniref:hypothetical protein n=1 Tax=Streptomyces sp. NPDC005728 TaxID=3157054 RepID=UPI00340030AE
MLRAPWRRPVRRRRGTAEILDKETNASGYTSNDELRYSLRSLAWLDDRVSHAVIP